MKISKAIEILGLLNYKTIRLLSRDEMEALKLGIEALKRHRDKDYITYNGMHEPLPVAKGETLCK